MSTRILSDPRVLATLPIGITLFFVLGGWMLALAYILIWIDKIPLRLFYIKTGLDAILYIEFITISTIFIGLHYAPVTAFLFLFLVPLALNSMRQFMMPADIGGGFIVPSFDNIIDGVLAAVMHLMKNMGLVTIMLIVQAIKHPLHIKFERTADPSKPPEVKVIFQTIFNFAIAIYLQDFSVFNVS